MFCIINIIHNINNSPNYIFRAKIPSIVSKGQSKTAGAASNGKSESPLSSGTTT